MINTRQREISPRYLSEDERVRIAELERQGLGVRATAAELGRSPATISRELRRNRDPDNGQYRPFTAQRLAVGQRARPGRGKLLRPGRGKLLRPGRGKLLQDPVLAQFVQDRLGKRWTPEQISHALRREFPDEPERHVVPETIYKAIYRPKLGGCAGIYPGCCGPGGDAANPTAARTPAGRPW